MCVCLRLFSFFLNTLQSFFYILFFPSLTISFSLCLLQPGDLFKPWPVENWISESAVMSTLIPAPYYYRLKSSLTECHSTHRHTQKQRLQKKRDFERNVKKDMISCVFRSVTSTGQTYIIYFHIVHNDISYAVDLGRLFQWTEEWHFRWGDSS